MSETYTLIYWPFLPGRGEYPRLILEDAGAPYVDLARLPKAEGGGVSAVSRTLGGKGQGYPTFAPPLLRIGGEDGPILAQMPVICHALGLRLGLAPEDPMDQLHALQLMLTVGDLLDAVHDTHHPLSQSLHYEDQLDAARVRAQHFLGGRLGAFLSYFERVLTHNGGAVLVGEATSYVDLALFHTLEGLAYAFPRGSRAAMEACPGLMALKGRVAERPRLKAYLASERRLPFNEQGIFRRYPELDLD